MLPKPMGAAFASQGERYRCCCGACAAVRAVIVIRLAATTTAVGIKLVAFRLLNLAKLTSSDLRPKG